MKRAILWSTPSTLSTSFYEAHQAQKTRQVHRARKYAKHVEDTNTQARNLSDSIVSR